MDGVAHETPIARGMNEPSAIQFLQMKRSGRRARLDGLGDLVSRQTVWPLPHEQAENAQALRMRQGRERRYGFDLFHATTKQRFLNFASDSVWTTWRRMAGCRMAVHVKLLSERCGVAVAPQSFPRNVRENGPKSRYGQRRRSIKLMWIRSLHGPAGRRRLNQHARRDPRRAQASSRGTHSHAT